MLTRPRRQVLATLALVIFSVFPSGYVAYSAYRVSQPGHLREVEAEVGRRLGVLVSVARASHPRPDVDVLEGVSLRLDNARHAEIARANTLRITRDGTEMTLRVGKLHLRGDGASDALGQALVLMRRLTSADADRISLVANTCDVDLGCRTETIRDLAAILQVDRSSPTLTASYLMPDDLRGSPTRCELTVRREAGEAGVITTVGLKTMDGPVPARVLDTFFDAESWLGASARLEGSLGLIRREGHEWEASFRGELSDVALSSIVGRRFAGQRLSGLARLTIDGARWSDRPGGQGSGWVEARGTLTAGPGSISVGLLRSMESRMKFRLSAPVDPRKTDLDFQGLGLRFVMNSAGELALGGGLGEEYAPDAVLVQGDRSLPLARAPEGGANVRGLWNMLIPAPAESLAPAVPEAQAMRFLPLPPSRVGPVSAN